MLCLLAATERHLNIIVSSDTHDNGTLTGTMKYARVQAASTNRKPYFSN